jgi:hypothetical protein
MQSKLSFLLTVIADANSDDLHFSTAYGRSLEHARICIAVDTHHHFAVAHPRIVLRLRTFLAPRAAHNLAGDNRLVR